MAQHAAPPAAAATPPPPSGAGAGRPAAAGAPPPPALQVDTAAAAAAAHTPLHALDADARPTRTALGGADVDVLPPRPPGHARASSQGSPAPATASGLAAAPASAVLAELVRVAESDAFTAVRALGYLYRFTDVGVQNYICQRLARCPTAEVEEVLPQLCHLLIARPQASVALQSFLVELCTHSMHCAVMVLWLLDAYLVEMADPALGADTALTAEESAARSEAYAVCVSLYHRCRRIIMSDGGDSDAAAAAGTAAAARSGPPPRGSAARTHVLPGSGLAAALGAGLILGGVALPALVASIGPLVVSHARSTTIVEGEEWTSEPPLPPSAPLPLGAAGVVRSVSADVLTGPSSLPPTPPAGAAAAAAARAGGRAVASAGGSHPGSPGVGSGGPTAGRSSSAGAPLLLPRRPPSVEDMHYGRAFSFNEYVAAGRR